MFDIRVLQDVAESELRPPPTISAIERRVAARRRRRRGLATTFAVMTLAVAAVVAAQVSGPGETHVAIQGPLRLGDIPDGVSTLTVNDTPLFIVRDDSNVRAFLPRSTHLGQQVWWCPKEQLFVSPAEGAVWTVDGRWVEGPPPRGLDEVQVQLESDIVRIDPSKVTVGPPLEPAVEGPRKPQGGSWLMAGFCADAVTPDAATRDDWPVRTVASGTTAHYDWTIVAGRDAIDGPGAGPECVLIVNGQMVCDEPSDRKHAIIGMLAGERIDVETPGRREHIAFGLTASDTERLEVLVDKKRWRTIRPEPSPPGFTRRPWYVLIPAEIPYITVDVVAYASDGSELGNLTSDGPDKPLR